MTRTHESDQPVALTIAGSDSGGGAGIQADLKTMEARGVFGTSAITSITAQNTQGVRGIEDVSPEMVAAQLEAITTDFDVGAAKTGMLSTQAIIEHVADALSNPVFPLVVDPVMVAQSGDRLLAEDAIAVLRDVLLPTATLVTPNLPEAELLTDVTITDQDSMETAARTLTDHGPTAALVTGGHLDTDEIADVLYTDELHVFRNQRVDTDTTHGSGCTLSAAITAELATGATIPDAVARAETILDRAITFGHHVGHGYGAIHHLADLHHRAARFDALAELRDAVRRLEHANIAPLIPEVGLNIAVAPAYAQHTDEIAAIDGRMTRTTAGVAATAGVWFGASGHMARFLLAVRAYDPSITVACNLRLTDEIEAALPASWDTTEIDRDTEPATVKHNEGGTMEWSVDWIMSQREPTTAPDAVIDRGDLGKEPMLRLLAPDLAIAEDRVLDLNRTLD